MSELAYVSERKNLVVIEIPGNPIPWKRAVPRSNSRGMFDAQKQLKLFWGITLRNAFEDREFFTGPCGMKITYYFKMPQNKKKTWEKMAGTFHCFKPDTSNLTKLIEDTAISILYHDDCIIAQTWAEKRYDYNPRTVLEVYSL